ncbi:MAG: hypothetical protein F4Y35_02545 [Chloroflexi bacterium]|nr:hypothetical protein [Chloroflexota bacterium]
MSDIITGTPADLTYGHWLVQEAWLAVWIVTSAALAFVIGWIGLALITQEPLGARQAGWRELIPRLILGVVAAAASLWWCALVIDVAHTVSGFIAAALDVTPSDLLRAPVQTLLTAVESGSVGLALLLALIYLIYGFFCLYLLLQMVLRLALIDILLALAPAAMGLWILPHSSGWSRHWLRLFMTTVFQQAVQLIALALGIGFLSELAPIGLFEPARDLIWKLLMSVAFIYLATRVPSMLGNASPFDAWLQTLYFGFSLPATLVRSVASVASIGAAGSGAARRAAVSQGAGSASGVGGATRSAAELSTPPGGSDQSGRGPRSRTE